MSESEIKLKIIRLIDSQNGETLKELYELILAKLYGKKKEDLSLSPIEEGYKAMSEDEEREEEAFEWIEGTPRSWRVSKPPNAVPCQFPNWRYK